MPADKLLALTAQREDSRFGPVADNYVLPTGSLVDYIAAGKAAHVPILEGANSQEQSYLTVLGDNPVTPEGFAATVKKLYGPRPRPGGLPACSHHRLGYGYGHDDGD
jgi:para-nitrobenzyl esterase